MNIFRTLRKASTLARRIAKQLGNSEEQALMIGRLLADNVKQKRGIKNLGEVEFKVFSQFGDDGIIQWLAHRLDFPDKTFIEFGVEDYRESNTRFLMMNDNWSGIVLDGSKENVERILGSEYYWKHSLTAKCAFIDTSNINDLIATPHLGDQLGILHIDLDGNDYWIWKEVRVSPVLVILEYNSVFGIDRPITVPYDPSFYRGRAHHSHLYFGASLRALHDLSTAKGYAFIGCNSGGNNAYFVRRDRLNEEVKEVCLEAGFVTSKYRESRDEEGRLTFVGGSDRLELIRGLPVVNTVTGTVETL
jgi:hypothetical protein